MSKAVVKKNDGYQKKRNEQASQPRRRPEVRFCVAARKTMRKAWHITLAIALAFTMMPFSSVGVAWADDEGRVAPGEQEHEQELLESIVYAAPLSDHAYGSRAYWEEVNNGPIVTTDLTALPNRTLLAGTYYITGIHTLKGVSPGEHGLTIAGAVTIRFVDGAKIVATGANGIGAIAGGNGIYLPDTAQLVVEGTGSITATGGTGGQAGDGMDGDDAVADYASGARSRQIAGAGGVGGNGAGAPGTGIGGGAGKGATGGAGGESVASPDDWFGYAYYLPNDGARGKMDNAGGSSGTLITKGSISVSAAAGTKAGAAGSGGIAGGGAFEHAAYSGSSRWWRAATAGAGGGGGGSSADAADIGSGGSGGGAGGGGSSGAIINYQKSSYYLGASGGGGGAGLGAGGTGSGYNDYSGGFKTPGNPGEAAEAYAGGIGGETFAIRHMVGSGVLPVSRGGDGSAHAESKSAAKVYSSTLTGAIAVPATNGDANEAERHRIYPLDECTVRLMGSIGRESDGTPVYGYTGFQVKPSVEIIHVPTDTVLTQGMNGHYYLEYASNINGGTATVTVKGIGFNHDRGTITDSTGLVNGTASLKFNIKYDIGQYLAGWRGAKIYDPIVYLYTGLGVGDAYLKTAEGIELPKSDYTVSYSENVIPGEGTAKATFSVPPDQSWKWFDSTRTITENYSIRKAPTITSSLGPYRDITPLSPYARLLEADGNAPMTWTIEGGELPPGLFFSADGMVSGIPEITGEWYTRIRVSNSVGYDEQVFLWKAGDVSGITWFDRNRNGVRDLDEDPIGGVVVTVYLADTNTIVDTVVSDEAGFYDVQGLLGKGIEAVDLVFTPPDFGLYRSIGSNTVRGINVTGMINTVNKGFEKAIDITLHAGEYGSFDGEATKQMRSFPGDPLVIGHPTDLTVDEDWRVEAWYYDEGLLYRFNNICPVDDTDLYANYDQRTYRVEYITGEGAEQVEPFSVDFNQGSLLPDPQPTRPGFELVAWVVANDPGRTVTDSDTYSALAGEDLDVMTIALQAVWEFRSDLAVTLDANGSTGAPATINGALNEVHENLIFDTVLNYSPPIREGYSFIGWSTSQDYDPLEDSLPTMSLKVPPQNTVYYAVWEARDIGVIFDAVGGAFEPGEDGMRNGEPGEDFDLPVAPKRYGYTFKGWYETPSGTALSYSAEERKGSFPFSKTYYYAQWEPSIVTIRLEADEGTPDTQSITGAYATTVAYDLPSRAGYAFMGWDVDGEHAFFLSFPAYDATYKAVWAIGSATVAFNPMGGTFATGENGIRQGNTGDAYALPADPARPGYTFAGWFMTPEGIVAAPTDGIMPTQSATYFAKWELADIAAAMYVDDVLFASPTGKYGAVIEYNVPTKAGATFVGWKQQGEDDAKAVMYPTYGEADGIRYDAVFQVGFVAVVYNAQGGSFTNDSGIRSGTTDEGYDIPGNPQKDGYEFEGWYDAQTGGMRVHASGQVSATFPSALNTVYYAHYTLKQITVILDAGLEAAPDSQTFTGGYQGDVPYVVPSKPGFSFMGWKEQGAPDSSAVKHLGFPGKDTTYQAVWAENSIELRFEAMGGSIDGSDVRSGIPGDSFALPEVEREGHAFLGWYDRASEGNYVFAPDAKTAEFPSATATYFAYWAPLGVTVTLDAGPGAIPEQQTASGLYGEAIEYAIPAKAGNAFIGWKVEGAPDDMATMIPLFSASEDVRYVAVWAAGQSSVCYDPQGGAFASGEQGLRTGLAGSAYTPPTDPIKAGHVFGGWFTHPEGQGDPYGETTFPAQTNTVVYAQWVPRSAEVVLEPNYVGAPSPERITGAAFAHVTYSMPLRDGYAFLGWSTAPDGISEDTTYFPRFEESSRTYYAQWAADAVSLRFHPVTGSFNGAEDGMRLGKVGQAYMPPADPIRPGYAFDGWFTDIEAGTKVVSNGMFPSASAVYYAHWTPIIVHVSLEGNYDGAPEPEIAEGVFLERVEYRTPVRAGYSFAGWGSAPDSETGEMSPTFPLAGPATLYAVWEPVAVTVTFDPLQGTFSFGSEAVHTGDPGEAYQTPVVSREGYAFKGWFTTPLGATMATVGTLPTEDATYYARWDALDVTVTLELEGGEIDGSADDVSLTGSFGETIPWKEPKREGYAFAGWKKLGQADASAMLFLSFPSADTTYQAVWMESEKSIVIYSALGGEVDGDAVQVGAPGDAYRAPAVHEREGYAFEGWANRATAVSASHQPDDEMTFPADNKRTVFFALWTAEEYRVTLDFDDGTTSPVERTGRIGDPVDFIDALPAREGFVFKGWASEPDATTYDLAPRHSAANDGSTLYAQWDGSALMVSFFERDGKGADIVLAGKAGQTYRIPNDPLRDGYTFTGWYSEKNGSGDALEKAAGDEAYFETGMKVAWYASWQRNDIGVTLDANGGTIEGSPSVEKTGHYGEAISYEAPMREGYTFAGWASGSRTMTALTYPAVSGQTYQVIWKAVPVTVVFNAMGGTFEEDETGVRKGDAGSNSSVPVDPWRTGYGFDGWFADPSCTMPASDLEYLPSADATYYAKWTPVTVSVQLSAPESSIELQTATGFYGDIIPAIAPIKAGSIFIGWMNRASNAVSMHPIFPETDAVFDARFAVGSVVVTFDVNGGEYLDGGSGYDTGIRAGEPGEAGFAPAAQAVARYGFDFQGWFTAPNGGTRIDDVNSKFTVPHLSTTYYAHWQRSGVSIKLDPQNGTPVQTKEGAHGDIVEYDIPFMVGHAFAGWATTPGNDFDDATMFPVYDIETSSTTLFGAWRDDAAHVTFFALGGLPNTEFTVKVNESYTVPADPQRAGFAFEGWYDSPSGGTRQSFKAGDAILVSAVANYTYYARYTPKAAIEVTLDAGADALPMMQEVTGTFGDQVSYIAPVREGYLFAGWKPHAVPVRPDGEAETEITFPAEDAAFTAVWKAANVTYTFDANGGALSGDGTRAGATDDAFDLPDQPVRTGYRFVGWYDMPRGGILVYASGTTASAFGLSSMTLFAHWSAIDSDVTLLTNGGAYTSDSSLSKTYQGSYDETVEYEIPVREGHSFVGWSTTADNGSDDASVTITISDPGTVYYAFWSAHQAAVIFRTEGGAFQNQAETGVREGILAESIGVVPELAGRPGYVFGGWYSEPRGGGIRIADDPVFLNLGTDIYYAYWIAESFEVVLDANGGVFPTGKAVTKTVTGKPGEDIAYGEFPQRAGYGFIGWSELSDADAGDLHPTFGPADTTYYALWKAGSATITFQPNGGQKNATSSDLAVTGEVGSTYVVPTVDRKGYSFKRWWTSPTDAAEGASLPGAPGETCTMAAGNATYYAQWTPVNQAITLDANGGTFAGGDTQRTVSGIQGALVAGLTGYQEPASDGRVFVGWSASADGSGEAIRYPHADAETATLYAVWQVKEVCVSYHAAEGVGGGTIVQDAASTYSAIPGGDPARHGYAFAGWYADPSSSVSSHPAPVDGEYTMPNDDMTWYAHWLPVTISLTLDAAGGSYADGSGTAGYTGPYRTLVIYEQPVKEGYRFVGWNDGSSVSLSLMFSSIDALTYTAEWIPLDEVSVTYELLGGSASSGRTAFQGLPSSAYTAAEVAVPSKEGCTFGGWFSHPDGAGRVHPDADGSGNYHIPDADTIWYASWITVPIGITLDPNGGTMEASDAPVVVQGGLGQAIAYSIPVRTGYAFAGWSQSAQAASGNLFPSFTFTLEGETLYAIWVADAVSAAFFPLGGSFADTASAHKVGKVGETYTVPANPIREGYAFAGWYLDDELTDPANVFAGDEIGFSGTVTNASYWAKWNHVSHTVILQGNGGSIGSEASVTLTGFSGDVLPYEMPTWEDHVFVGWNPDASAETGTLSLAFPDEDATYHAIWKTRIISVHFEPLLGTMEGVADFEGASGAPYAVPTASRVGYTFVGWGTKTHMDAPDGPEVGTVGTFPKESTTYYAQWEQDVTTITLDLEGGSVDGSDDDIVLTGYIGERLYYKAPVLHNHIFMGWRSADEADADARIYCEFPAHDETYYAVWKRADMLHARYHALGGDIIGSDAYDNEASDRYRAPTAIAPMGYSFSGWAIDPDSGIIDHRGGDSKAFGPQLMKTYHAVYLPVSNITVTLDPAGGLLDGSPYAKMIGNLVVGGQVGYSIPVRDGFTFIGWALDPLSGQANRYLEVPKADTVYYAIWKAGGTAHVSYAHYHALGGEVDGEALYQGKAGEVYRAPSVVSREGYTFHGWMVAADAYAVEHRAGDIRTFDATPKKDYYAWWQVRSDITVRLNVNGGTWDGSATADEMLINQRFGASVAVAAPQREGHLFLGWSTDASASVGTPNIVVPGTDATFFALWMDISAPADNSIVFYDGAGGMVDGYALYDGIAASPYTAPSASREGFAFRGWSSVPDGAVDHAAGSSRTLPANGWERYWAVWTARSDITITLDPAGGTLKGSNVLTGQLFGSTIMPEAPVRDGYLFVGWLPADAQKPASALIEVGAADEAYMASWQVMPDVPDEFIVSYDGTGGVVTPATPIIGPEGQGYMAPTAARRGFDFIGWAATAAGAIDHGAGEARSIPDRAITTYYALWKVKSDITVTVKPNNGSDPDVAYKNLIAGDVFYPASPSYPGHIFAGWVREGTDDVPSTAVVVHESATYIAHWREAFMPAETRVVLFDSQGGTIADGGAAVISGGQGSPYVLPSVDRRLGFVFEGWNLGGALYQPGAHMAFDSDLQKTFKAQWRAVPVDIELVAPGSDKENQLISGSFGEAVPFYTPIIHGKTFMGWKREGSPDSLAQRDLTFPQENAVYLAVWDEAGDVDVLYDPTGGTGVDGSSGLMTRTGKPGMRYAVPDGMYKSGYCFSGWYEMPNAQGQPHPQLEADGSTVFPGQKSIWYAAWDAVPLRTTLDATGGTIEGQSSLTLEGESGSIITYETPVRVGYAFVGWAHSPTAIQGDLTPRFDPASGERTLYAVWRAGKVSVAFLTGSDDPAAIIVGNVGESYAVPEDPDNEGHSFLGWFDTPSGGSKMDFKAGDAIVHTEEANTAYWAQWEKESTTVTLDGNGVVFADAVKVGRFGDAIAYAQPEREGYDFRGWALSGDASEGQMTLTFPAHDKTYFALWIPRHVVVTFDATGGVLAGRAEYSGRYGEGYVPPSDPERSGYTFKGWATQIDGSADQAIGVFPSRNIVYYALWDSTEGLLSPVRGSAQTSEGSGSAAGTEGSASEGGTFEPDMRFGGRFEEPFKLVLNTAGGSIHLSEEASSRNQTYLFVPAEGYLLDSVMIDGTQIEVGTDAHFLAAVQGEHAIDARFILDTIPPLASFELAARNVPVLWLIPGICLLALSGLAVFGIARIVRKKRQEDGLEESDAQQRPGDGGTEASR